MVKPLSRWADVIKKALRGENQRSATEFKDAA
jgi:hypothetical protein